MARIVKEINGHRYVYKETWDRVRKRPKWRYVGKFEGEQPSLPKNAKNAVSVALSALYDKCAAGGYGVNFDRRQLKRLKLHIREVEEDFC